MQSGIRDAAENIGLRTASARLRLRKVVPLPYIAHWYRRHFIVRMTGPCFRPGTGPAETLRTGFPERPVLRHGSIDQTKKCRRLEKLFRNFLLPEEDLPRTTGAVHIMRRITISGNSVRFPVSMVGFPPQSWDQRTQRLIGQRAIRPYFKQSLFI